MSQNSVDLTKMKLLFDCLNDINDIIECDNDNRVRNHDTKLDAVLSVIQEIDKKDFDDKLTDVIINSIKTAIEDIYRKEVMTLNREIGFSINMDHCERVTTQNKYSEIEKPIPIDRNFDVIDNSKQA